MRDLSLSLRQTDQSSITKGDVSLSHVLHTCNHRDPQMFAGITGTSLRSLRLKGFWTLADVGEWTIDLEGHIGITSCSPSFDKTWSTAAKANWTRLMSALCHKLQIDDLVSGPADLALPREL